MNEAKPTRHSPWAGLRAIARRIQRYAWDNPSAEQDARGILSAPKLGSWLGLEILLLCAGAGFAFALLPSEASVFHQAMVKAGTGQYLTSASLITLTAFLTLIVPLRSAGLLEGPRWRGYMDQLVTTGITPLRYFAGKWATSQTFFVGLLLASLPMTVLYGLLGGATVGRTLAAYALIYAYCNLLLLLTLALGTLLHEIAAVLVVWNAFALLTVLDYLPCPSTVAAFTPHRFLIQPFVESLAGSSAGMAMQIYGDPQLLGVQLPWPLYAGCLWLVIGLLAGVTLCLGPLHRFLPGTNNFGAVVLPGDAKRLFFRRIRPLLTRRVELAFLFENRGPRLVRWTLPIRALQQLGGFTLFALMLVGLAYHPATIAEIQNYLGLVSLETSVFVILMLGLVYSLSTGRSDVSQGFVLAPGLRVPLFCFDLGVLASAFAVLIVVHAGTVAAAWPDLTLTPGLSQYSSIESAPELLVRSSTYLGIVLVVAFLVFLVTKTVGCRILSRDVSFVLGLAYLLALLVVPLLLLGAAEAVRRADDRALHEYARPLMVFAQLSPAMPIVMAEQPLPSSYGPPTHWLFTHAFWFWSALQGMALLVAALASNLTSWREARLVGGEVLRDGPPCPKCDCAVAAPLGWSWWGGALIPLVLGYVRCVECHHEFHERTGTRSTLLLVGAFAGRLLLSILVVVALVTWVVVAVRVTP